MTISTQELDEQMKRRLLPHEWKSLFHQGRFPYGPLGLPPVDPKDSPVDLGRFALPNPSSSSPTATWMRVGLAVFFYDRTYLTGYCAGEDLYLVTDGVYDGPSRRALACTYLWARSQNLSVYLGVSLAVKILMQEDIRRGGLMGDGLAERVKDLREIYNQGSNDYRRINRVEEGVEEAEETEEVVVSYS